ncbi:MAG: rhomboid family intramembrane serine protease [Verrucomicrobiae bacterium]|nr:rhomboid family intramembrane serine protease [Verrucomicrobiae bacterium]
MLSDRAYMREPEGAGFRIWRASTLLMLAMVVCFALQHINAAYIRKPDYYFYLALSPDGIRQGYLWQPVTYMFLHVGLFHLLFNLLGIYFFGRVVESYLGWKKFLAIFFAGGIMGGILQTVLGFFWPDWFAGSHYDRLLQPAGEVYGSSAGVCALLAVFCLLEPRATILLFFLIPLQASYLLYGSLAIALFFTVVPTDPGVAHAAHLGGLLTGMGLVKIGFHQEYGGLWNRLPNPRDWLPRRRHPSPATPGRAASDFPRSEEIDPILDKISAQGIHSLTAEERRILEDARKKMAR